MAEQGDTAPRVAAPVRWGVTAALVLLPLVLLSWLNPITSPWTIGNDYQYFSTPCQQELFLSVEHGSFPLFVPGFSGGQTSAALTLGQLHHPQSWLVASLPGYWQGDALARNTLVRLLALGVAHVVVFWLFLRLLAGVRGRWALALVVSTVTVHNLRMLDTFRFGASLESWTGHLVACASLVWLWLEPRRVLPVLGTIGASYGVVVSGHPQNAYYGLATIAIAALATPAWARALGFRREAGGRAVAAYYGRAAACGAVALLAAAAYAAPFWADFLRHNTVRVGQDYAWADPFRDSVIGTVDNFLRPLRTSTQDAFGGTAWILPVALLPLLALLRVRVPRVLWVLWAAVLLVFLHAQGGRTPVHRLVWSTFPLASNLRIAGRVTYLMPWLLALLGLWLARAEPVRVPGLERRVPPLAVLAALGLVATAVRAALPEAWTDELANNAPVVLHEIPPAHLAAHLWLGVGVLAVLAAWGLVERGRGAAAALGLALAAGVLGQTWIALHHGTYRAEAPSSPTLAQLEAEKREALAFRGHAGHGLASSVIVRHLEETSLEPALGRLFRDHEVRPTTEAVYARMAEGRRPEVVVLEGDVAPSDGPTQGPQRVTLEHASYNRFVFRTEAAEAAWFGFGMPWSPSWRASVDGEPVRPVRANGAYVGLPVPAGEHELELRWASPAAVAGTLVSALALAGVGLWLALRTKRRALWPLVAALALALPGGSFLVWRASLYSGEGLGTRFQWTSGAERADLAFGRPTALAEMKLDYFVYTRGSGLAVDGDPATGFLTDRGEDPTWSVDLGEERAVERLVLRRAERVAGENRRPIVVEGSTDGVSWRPLAEVRAIDPGPWDVPLPPGTTARHLRLRLVGVGRLGFDEVEVHGPEGS